MSYRYGTALLPGAYHYGHGGLGVPGSQVPSTGQNGPGYLYGSLTLPADNNVEVRGLVTSPPVGVISFAAYEDSSFIVAANDGTYTFTFELYADGVDLGPAVGTFTIGSTVGGNVALDDAIAAGSITGGTVTLSGNVALDDDVAAGGFTSLASGSLSGNVTLDDVAPSGGFSAASPATSVVLTLTIDGSAPAANLSGLKWAFFDQAQPSLFAAPSAKGSAGSTDGSGVLSLSIAGTTLIGGQTGWLIVTDSDGTVAQNPAEKAFSGPVLVS